MTEGSGDQYEALRREAAHRLADTLAPYGVLTRDKLVELSGASRWTRIEFDPALRWAVEHDFVRRLDEELYEIGPADRAEGDRLELEGGW
jgi:hypothetical protein